MQTRILRGIPISINGVQGPDCGAACPFYNEILIKQICRQRRIKRSFVLTEWKVIHSRTAFVSIIIIESSVNNYSISALMYHYPANYVFLSCLHPAHFNLHHIFSKYSVIFANTFSLSSPNACFVLPAE